MRVNRRVILALACAAASVAVATGCTTPSEKRATTKQQPLEQRLSNACPGASTKSVTVRSAGAHRAEFDRYIVLCGDNTVVTFDDRGR